MLRMSAANLVILRARDPIPMTYLLALGIMGVPEDVRARKLGALHPQQNSRPERIFAVGIFVDLELRNLDHHLFYILRVNSTLLGI